MNKLEALENVNYIDQDGTDIKLASYDIEFRDVSFGYDSWVVLHDLNFKIPQNSTTAIVGPSGSGKSTLCNLIARFYDVNSGTITIGGTDIRRFTCDSLLKNISMVFQNVYLFRIPSRITLNSAVRTLQMNRSSLPQKRPAAMTS